MPQLVLVLLIAAVSVKNPDWPLARARPTAKSDSSRALGGPLGHRPWLAITNSYDDRISLEADTLLVTRGLAHDGQIDGPSSSREYKLRNGRLLRIDDKTPAGDYELQDGSEIHLFDKEGYPRPWSSAGPFFRVVDFCLKSSAQVGAVFCTHCATALTIEETPTDEIIARFTGQLWRRYWPTQEASVADSVLIVPEFGRSDYYCRVWLEIPNYLSGQMTVVFIGYGNRDFQVSSREDVRRTARIMG